MKAFLRVLSIICLIAWMGLIFFFSHQTAEQSSAISGSVIEVLVEKFYPDFEILNELQKEELISSLQSVVRSVAHFCIYGGLGFFAYLTFVSYVSLKYKTRVFWMLETCLLYAISDEFHQTFIDGRSMQLIDIAVDFAGVVTAVLICSLFVLIIGPLRRKVRYKASNVIIEPLNYNIEYQEYDYPLEEENQISEAYEENTMFEKLNDIENIEEAVTDTEPQKTMLSEEFEYAAGIIGKTVVEATRVCNELTLKDSNDTKELVNLVLGRTEVLKAEILKILNSDGTFEQKKDLMQKEQMASYDYFDSIKAQIG